MSINHRLMDGKAFTIKNIGIKLNLPTKQLKYYSHKVDSNKKNSATINHDKGVKIFSYGLELYVGYLFS